MPMSEPIMGWCIQCGKEHGGVYCPQDPNPPKNAAYWKRRALKAEAMYEKAARENTWSFVKRNAMKEALKVIAAYTQQCPTTDSRHMAKIAREALVEAEDLSTY